MHDPNRLIKWLVIIAMVVVSLAVLYPPSEKLKGGIDLVGGTSLLFEIDTAGLDASMQRDLASRVMRVLKERIDPKGQMNLEWRPVGSTRLEIRMPRPPKEALARRELYNQAVERLSGLNLKRRDVEEALNASGTERETRLAALQRGVKERAPLIAAVADAFAAHTSAQAVGEASAIAAASAAYEKAMSDLMASVMPLSRFNDVVALSTGEKRNAEVQKLRTEFPSYDAGEEREPGGKLLTKATTAYDAWAAYKADLEDPSDLKRRLRGAGVLEFRILADRDPTSPTNTMDARPELRLPIKKYAEQLAKYGPRPKAGDRFRWFALEDVLKFTNTTNIADFEAKRSSPNQPIIEEYAGRYYVLMHNDAEYGMLQGSGKSKTWSLRQAYPDRNPLTGENVVAFALDARGGRQFGELTGPNVNRQLCIMLDNTAISHANIRERITDRCQISGRFSPEDVQYLVGTLEAGSLPARLKETPLSEQTIGPSLGETNREHGVRASYWGAGLTIVFVLFYYGLAGGGGTTIALSLNLLFTLAIMGTMQATFTLPGIAGLLLSIGMAIDANVLIFERIREERTRGVVFKKALLLGYDKAFSAIFDGNLTTMITCVILGFVGSEEIKGFAITLGIGIAMSMFTALTVTKLIYTTLLSQGWLNDFSMRKLIGVPTVNWMGLRRVFWPTSTVAVVAGLGLFFWMSFVRTESFFDIEFLGGTSLQIDLKPGLAMTDEQIRQVISAGEGDKARSAVQWLRSAADGLGEATAAQGETPGQFTLTAKELSGDQTATLMRRPLESALERDGVSASGPTATFVCRPGSMTLEGFRAAVATAADQVRAAADRIRSARVQSVGEQEEGIGGLSYEVVTVETNRPVLQTAILAVLGDKLSIQRGIRFTAIRDEELTKDSFFVIESDDQYLSDVISGDAGFDVRGYRGGVAIQVDLASGESPIAVGEFERRVREVGLQPEFEQFRARDWTVFPLGPSVTQSGKSEEYRQFVVCSVDESVSYDDDPQLWTDSVARPELSLVEAALGSEKSLSKVVQFAPQIAGQTRNRAMFAIVLSMVGIGAYVWLRFGTRNYALAILVTMVHDVCIVLGLIAASHWIHDTFLGSLLMIDDFKFDLTMLAAVLTIIGYQLNDTIVVFDRIRESLGRTGALSANLVNDSINQTMSRTILTATLVTLTVITLYLFGGDGVHGFAYAMLIGTIAGTYSTIAVAVPLVCSPMLLRNIVTLLVGLGCIGMAFAVAGAGALGLALSGMIALLCVWTLSRSWRGGAARPAGQPA
ncbi:MAG: protein translocase subunit SecD [Planctomycetota bacterium]